MAPTTNCDLLRWKGEQLITPDMQFHAYQCLELAKVLFKNGRKGKGRQSKTR
jgi:hypothetical protein